MKLFRYSNRKSWWQFNFDTLHIHIMLLLQFNYIRYESIRNDFLSKCRIVLIVHILIMPWIRHAFRILLNYKENLMNINNFFIWVCVVFHKIWSTQCFWLEVRIMNLSNLTFLLNVKWMHDWVPTSHCRTFEFHQDQKCVCVESEASHLFELYLFCCWCYMMSAL